MGKFHPRLPLSVLHPGPLSPPCSHRLSPPFPCCALLSSSLLFWCLARSVPCWLPRSVPPCLCLSTLVTPWHPRLQPSPCSFAGCTAAHAARSGGPYLWSMLIGWLHQKPSTITTTPFPQSGQHSPRPSASSGPVNPRHILKNRIASGRGRRRQALQAVHRTHSWGPHTQVAHRTPTWGPHHTEGGPQRTSSECTTERAGESAMNYCAWTENAGNCNGPGRRRVRTTGQATALWHCGKHGTSSILPVLWDRNAPLATHREGLGVKPRSAGKPRTS